MDLERLLAIVERELERGTIDEQQAAVMVESGSEGRFQTVSQLRRHVQDPARIKGRAERGEVRREAAREALDRTFDQIKGLLSTAEDLGPEDAVAAGLGLLRQTRDEVGKAVSGALKLAGADAAADRIAAETFEAGDRGLEPVQTDIEAENPIAAGTGRTAGSLAALFAPFADVTRTARGFAAARNLPASITAALDVAGGAATAGALGAVRPDLSFFPEQGAGQRALAEAGVDLALGIPMIGLVARGGQRFVRLHRFTPEADVTSRTGVRGAEDARRANDPEGFTDRLNFYVNGTGQPESFPGVGDARFVSTVEVPESALYDLAADPEGVVARVSAELAEQGQVLSGTNINVLENALKREGFLGYVGAHSPDGRTAQGAVLFDTPELRDEFLSDAVTRENPARDPDVTPEEAVGLIEGQAAEALGQTGEAGARRQRAREAVERTPGPSSDLEDLGREARLDLDAVDAQNRAEILELRKRGLRFFPAFFDETGERAIATGPAHTTGGINDLTLARRLEDQDAAEDGFFDIVTGRFLTRDEMTQARGFGESGQVRQGEVARGAQPIPAEQARADLDRVSGRQTQTGARPDVPRQFAQPQQADEFAATLTRERGGATINPRTGEDMLGADEFAVSMGSEFERKFDRPFTPEDVAQFRRDHAAQLEDPNVYLGTWVDPDTGVSEINLTEGFQSLDDAVAMGRARDQKSIAHLGDPLLRPEFGPPAGPAFPDITDDLALAQYRARLDDAVPERAARRLQRFVSRLADESDAPGAVEVDRFARWSPEQQARTLRNFSLLGDSRRSAVAAVIGSQNQLWYENSARALSDMFGPDAPRFGAVLASTSPQASVEDNMEMALRFWRDWDGAGRPTDPQGIERVIDDVIDANPTMKAGKGTFLNNLIETFRRTDEELLDPGLYNLGTSPSTSFLSGQKVDAFAANLARNIQFQDMRQRFGSFERTTNDTHIGRGAGSAVGAGSEVTLNRLFALQPFHREAADFVSQAAGRRVLPDEIQAMEWATFKAISDRLGTGAQRRNRTYSEVVEGLIESGDPVGSLRADIAQTPSFASVLHNPRFTRILGDMGIEPPPVIPTTRNAALDNVFDPDLIREEDVERYLREIGTRMDAAGSIEVPGMSNFEGKPLLFGLAAAASAATLGGLVGDSEEAQTALAAGALAGIPIRGGWARIARRAAEVAGLSGQTFNFIQKSRVGMAPFLRFLAQNPSATPDDIAEFTRLSLPAEGFLGAPDPLEAQEAIRLGARTVFEDMQTQSRRQARDAAGQAPDEVQQSDLFGRDASPAREGEVAAPGPAAALPIVADEGLVLHGTDEIFPGTDLFAASIRDREGRRVPVDGGFRLGQDFEGAVPRINISGMGPMFVGARTLEAAGNPGTFGPDAVGPRLLLRQIREAAAQSDLPAETRLVFNRAGTTGGALMRGVNLPVFPGASKERQMARRLGLLSDDPR